MGAEKDNLVSGGAEQVFKSTDIYKSESQKGGDVFEKEKTKKEKFLEWAKEHRKLCVLIVAGVVAILAIIVVLIVLLVNSGTQETSEGVVSEEEQVVEPPDIEIVPDESSSRSYLGSVYEVVEYYGDDLNGATEFIGQSIQEALDAGDTEKAMNILISEAQQFSLDKDYERANAVLQSVDLGQFSAGERLGIANAGMNIARNLDGGMDSVEYEYWLDVYAENVEGGLDYGG